MSSNQKQKKISQEVRKNPTSQQQQQQLSPSTIRTYSTSKLASMDVPTGVATNTSDNLQHLESIRKLTDSDYLCAGELNNNTILATTTTTSANSTNLVPSLNSIKIMEQTKRNAGVTAAANNKSSQVSSDSNKTSATSQLADSTKTSELASFEEPSSNSKYLSPSAEQQENDLAPANQATPSYSSIFNTNYFRKTSSSPTAAAAANHNQNQHSRAQLKKQLAAEILSSVSSEPQSTRLQERKLHSANYNGGFQNREEILHHHNHFNKHNNEIVDDDSEDDIDEQLPLSTSSINSMTKQTSKSTKLNNNNKRISPVDSNRCSPTTAINDKQRPIFDRCEHHHHHLNGQHPPPHTKISFNGNGNIDHKLASSFTTCQSGHFHDVCSRKPLGGANWQDSSATFECDCLNCYKKFKYAMAGDGCCSRGRVGPGYSEKGGCSRTDVMHRVLKTIILILLTLLLFMLFTGIIVASHYLPQMFDKLLSATRSFNVTIAG